MKMIITAYGILVFILFSTIAYGQVKETFESIVNNGISKGIIKRDGNKIIYLAALTTDTAKIRGYYENLIKKSGKLYHFSFENKAAVTPVKSIDITNDKTIALPKLKNTDNPNSIIKENNNDNLRAIPAITEGTPGVQLAPGGCWTRQIVYQAWRENWRQTFVVPFGVTSIKIEAWSGGGNGKIVQRTGNGNMETPYRIFSGGGGGGGGAYANAVIDVKQGDTLFITIPYGGEGKELVILLNNNRNRLVLVNGMDASLDNIGGRGGYLLDWSGIFMKTAYWFAGEAGEILQQNLHDESREAGLIIVRKYWLDRTFGNGGSAALLNNGGRGGKDIFLGQSLEVQKISKGHNGGHPGGGGGGGNLELSPGYYGGSHFNETLVGTSYGAPGMVIIHY